MGLVGGGSEVVEAEVEEEVGVTVGDNVGVAVELEPTGRGGGWLATGAGSLPVFPNLSGMA
jgi:hypothetical protein